MKVISSFFLILLVGCSSKYIGISDPIYNEYACQLSEDACSISYGGLSTDYKVRALGHNQYHIVGTTRWDNTRMSAVYQKVKRLRLVFAFMEEGVVVHTENAWVRGDEGEIMAFDFEFSTDISFDSTLVIDFQGRVTE